MPQSWDMGQIILLPLRRKACWGFFHKVTLLHFLHDRFNWSFPSFSSTTFQNFPGVFDLLNESSKFQHHLNETGCKNEEHIKTAPDKTQWWDRVDQEISTHSWTRRFAIVFTTVSPLTLLWARWNQFKTSPHLKIHFNITVPDTTASP
jgi:hypothetical protein